MNALCVVVGAGGGGTVTAVCYVIAGECTVCCGGGGGGGTVTAVCYVIAGECTVCCGGGGGGGAL